MTHLPWNGAGLPREKDGSPWWFVGEFGTTTATFTPRSPDPEKIVITSIRSPSDKTKNDLAAQVALGVRHGLDARLAFNRPTIWGDRFTAVENKVLGRLLCDTCDGTGNELYSMYRACCRCGGKGYISTQLVDCDLDDRSQP